MRTHTTRVYDCTYFIHEPHLLYGTDADGIGIAYLVVKEANPDATDEEFEAAFRKAAREGVISITSLF